MPTVIPSKPSRKPSTRRPSRSSARRPAADKTTTSKCRKAAAAQNLTPGPGSTQPLTPAPPGPNDGPDGYTPRVETIDGLDHFVVPVEGIGGNQLRALVVALLGFVAAWRPRLSDPVALIVLRGIEALLGRVGEMAKAPPERQRPVVHTTGPVAGLQLAATDPGESHGPCPPIAETTLASLYDDLALVLDHRTPSDDPNGHGDNDGVLWCAVSELLGLVRRHIATPGSRLEHASEDIDGDVVGGLRLGTSTEADDASLGVEASKPDQTASVQSVADETMRQLGDSLLDLHDGLRTVQDELVNARKHLRDFFRDAKSQKQSTVGLPDIEGGLEGADHAFWNVLADLNTAIATVIGGSGHDPLPQNVGQLKYLVDELGGKTVFWMCDPDKARASWSGGSSKNGSK